MATVVEIASSRIQNAETAAKAAKAVGLPAYVAFALLDMESEGRNFFGSDSGGLYKGEEVTEAKYKDFLKKVLAGAPSNGVGPTQITYAGPKRADGTRSGGFFTQAADQGLELWKPYDNMVFGFKLIKGYADRYPGDWQKVGRLYNGKDSYGNTFVRVVGEWKERLKNATEEETEMATWHLAPSLKKLQSDLDDVLGDNRPNDGTIGDQAHAARSSEHNPDNDADSMPKGAVSAIDVYTEANGKTWISPTVFSKLLAILKKDSRVWYIIHKGYIYSRTYNFAKRKYTGSNPHNTHIHISLVQTKAAHDNTASWKISGIKGGTAPAPSEPEEGVTKKYPTLSIGDEHELVLFLKRFFGLEPNDKVFGRGLLSKVRAYQTAEKLTVDGVVGLKTWTRIRDNGTKLPDGYSL